MECVFLIKVNQIKGVNSIFYTFLSTTPVNFRGKVQKNIKTHQLNPTKTRGLKVKLP